MTAVDWSGKRLGWKPSDPGRVMQAVRFGEHLITPPLHPIAVDDTRGIAFGMDHNDQFGDCVVAGRDHARQIWTRLLTGQMKVMTWAEIIADYRTQNSRFNPRLAADDPRQQDGGMVIEQYLALLQKRGDIVAYALVDHTNEEMVKAAAYLDLALIGGFTLTEPNMNQTTFDYAPTGPVVGGHCMVYASYQPHPDRLGLVTWGTVLQSTPAFLRGACGELWFVITKDHLAHPGFRAHYDVTSFANAFRTVTGRPFPGGPA